MINDLVKENERIDDLQNGYYIIQDPRKFCFGMDAVLLSGTEFQFAYREFLNFFHITNFYYYLYKLAEYIYTLYIALDSVWSSRNW